MSKEEINEEINYNNYDKLRANISQEQRDYENALAERTHYNLYTVLYEHGGRAELDNHLLRTLAPTSPLLVAELQAVMNPALTSSSDMPYPDATKGSKKHARVGTFKQKYGQQDSSESQHQR